jgi:hypothetical protein
MQYVLNFFKRVFWNKRESFYYIKEEIQFEHQAENTKVDFLTSYKKVS